MADFENEQKGTIPSGADNVSSAPPTADNQAVPTVADSPYIAMFETGKHYKVQKSYIAMAPVIALFVALVFTVFNNLEEHLLHALEILENFTGPFADFVVLIALFVPFVLRWRSMSYVFDERGFSFYSGVFSKHRVQLPYTQAQSLSYHASPLQRIFRVCTVSIDRSGGSAKALRVPYVKRTTFEKMRAELSMRKEAMLAGMSNEVTYIPNVEVTTFDNEPVTYEYRLKKGDLLKTALTNDKPVIAAIVVLLLGIIISVIVLFVNPAAMEDVRDTLILLLIAVMIVVWIFGLFPILLKYGRFRARRRGSRIEVEHGVLSHDFTSMDADCVEYIEAYQSPLRRLTGSCVLSFGRTTFASKEKLFTKLKKLVISKIKKKKKAIEKAETLVVHPYAKLDHANEILDNLAPELSGRPHREECKPLPKIAFRRALIRECLTKNKVFWICVAILVAWWILNIFVISRLVLSTFTLDLEDGGPVLEISVLDIYYRLTQFVTIGASVVGFITLILKALTARRYAKKSGYVWNDDYLLLFDAGSPTHQTVIPRNKIQSGVSEASWGQRKKSVATLQANTFTGSQSVIASLVDVSAEETDAYLDWLKPRG